jgi:hypothetical protein
MLPFHVDQSWYERAWLTERAPSRAARFSLQARIVARRLTHAIGAVAALYASRQPTSDSSPSFR